MAHVGSVEARAQLPALLERVQKGERILITEHGVAVAMLVPVEVNEPKNRRDAIQALREFGRGRTLPGGLTVRDLIEEGRRY